MITVFHEHENIYLQSNSSRSSWYVLKSTTNYYWRIYPLGYIVIVGCTLPFSFLEADIFSLYSTVFNIFSWICVYIKYILTRNFSQYILMIAILCMIYIWVCKQMRIFRHLFTLHILYLIYVLFYFENSIDISSI